MQRHIARFVDVTAQRVMKRRNRNYVAAHLPLQSIPERDLRNLTGYVGPGPILPLFVRELFRTADFTYVVSESARKEAARRTAEEMAQNKGGRPEGDSVLRKIDLFHSSANVTAPLTRSPLGIRSRVEYIARYREDYETLPDRMGFPRNLLPPQRTSKRYEYRQSFDLDWVRVPGGWLVTNARAVSRETRTEMP